MGISMELGQFTLAEYRSQHNNGVLEIYDGKCCPRPSLTSDQLDLISRIHSVLRVRLPEHELRTVPSFLCPLAAPNTPDGDVTDVVVPALTVISDRCQLIPGGCLGVPDLVIEIASCQLTSSILRQKQILYAKAGIPEWWLVFPDRHEIQVYSSNDTCITLHARWQKHCFGHCSEHEITFSYFQVYYLSNSDSITIESTN